MKPHVNIITLAVDDLEKSLRFYRDGLGFPTPGIVDGADHVAFDLQTGLSFVLYPRAEIAKLAKTSATPSSSECILSHPAASKEDVDAILLRAEAAGAALLDPPKEEAWGYSGYFKDPDGHLWEILHMPEDAVEGENSNGS